MFSRFDTPAVRTYRRLLGYVRPHLAVILGAVGATILHAGADAVVPFLMKQVIAVLQDAGRHGSYLIPVLIAILFPIRGTMDFLATYGMNWVGRSVIVDLRKQLFEHSLALPVRYFNDHASGVLISKLTYNTEQVAAGISNAVVVLGRDSLAIVILLGVMIYMSPELTLLVAVVGPTIGFLVAVASKALRRYSIRIQDSMGEFTRMAQQALDAYLVIRIFEAQSKTRRDFATVNERNARLQVRLASVRVLGDSLTQLAVSAGIATVVLVAFWAPGELGAPQFVGFLTAMGMLLAPLRRLTNVNATLQKAIAAADSLFETLDEPSESDNGRHGLERATGRVEFRGVSFRYPGANQQALKDFSIAVEPGSRLALVGRSGSGKSTVASLLARFHDVDGGSVLLDGVDVRDYRLQDLRAQLGFVSQDVVLFDDTIANNIAYAAPASTSRKEIERAAEAAHVTEFAMALELGLDARVGEGGALLSGGQRQRIAIARALLRDAPILIMDEATSALDTESERRIQEALVHLMKGRTTLVIAHRLSTIETADQIVAMRDGEIVEAGTHEQLMRQGGYYLALQRAQLAA